VPEKGDVMQNDLRNYIDLTGCTVRRLMTHPVWFELIIEPPAEVRLPYDTPHFVRCAFREPSCCLFIHSSYL
jgi:hypothetical protein